MVEQPAVNRFVVGSSPTRGASSLALTESQSRSKLKTCGKSRPKLLPSTLSHPFSADGIDCQRARQLGGNWERMTVAGQLLLPGRAAEHDHRRSWSAWGHYAVPAAWLPSGSRRSCPTRQYTNAVARGSLRRAGHRGLRRRRECCTRPTLSAASR